MANDAPVAVMFDVVHPKVSMPEDGPLRAALERGQMVLDVLIDLGVPVTYARTRVIPSLISPRERAGKLLGVRRTTAVLELEELYYAGRDERVAYSRDLFAPGGLDVTVMRSFESTRPDPDRERPRLAERPRRRRSAPPPYVSAGSRQRVASVARALALLDEVARSDAGLGVNELARRIGVNASTASRLLATLEEGGLVERSRTGPTGSG